MKIPTKLERENRKLAQNVKSYQHEKMCNAKVRHAPKNRNVMSYI